MTKKLAEALMKHKHDDEVMIDRLLNGTEEEYAEAFKAWDISGEECKKEIESYDKVDYLPSFYGNGKYDLYDLASKYLNRLDAKRRKNSLQNQ